MRFRKLAVHLTLVGALLHAPATYAAPTALDLLVQKARSLEARDRSDLAEQVWEQVLIADPKQPDALAGLARCAKRSGKTAEANTYIARLRALDPTSSALLELDTAKSVPSHDGRLDEAAKLAAGRHYEEALKVYRAVFGNTPPAGGWALAYYETQAQTPGGFETAVAALKKLAEEHPELPDYQVTAGRLLTYHTATRAEGVALLAAVKGGSSATGKAREAWRQALVWEKANRAFIPAVRTYLSRYPDSELQANLEAVTALPAVVPSAGELAMSKEEGLGYRALRANNIPEAEAKFTAALETDAKSSGALAGLGFVRMKQGNFSAAIEQFEAAQHQRPKNSELAQALQTARFWDRVQAGAHAAQDEDFDTAIKDYSDAIAIRGNSPEALLGLAGAYLQAGQGEKAVTTYQRVIDLDPKKPQSWEQLLRAKARVDTHSAVEALKALPPSVSARLSETPSFEIFRVRLYAEDGQDDQAAKLFANLNYAGIELSPDSQVELASLLVRFGHPEQASESMQRLTARTPNVVQAWEVLVSALAKQGRHEAADTAVEQMPEPVRRTALTHPGFLQTVAGLEAADAKPEQARKFLERVLAMPDSSAPRGVKLDVKTQLATLLAANGQPDEAQKLISAVLEARPQDASAWKAYLSVLSSRQQYRQILSEVPRVPDAVSLQLRNDADVVGLLARAQASVGNNAGALQLLMNYMGQASAAGTPADLSLQLAWLLLDVPGQQRQLYSVLQQVRLRSDLRPAQTQEVSNLWVTWISRSADAASKADDPKRSIALLEEGLGQFPNEPRLERSLAGALLKNGDSKRAFNVYSNWGLTGGEPADYAGAVGAAITEGNQRYADAWLDKGLAQWPADSQLLTLAGERARSKGDLKRAAALWREAVAAHKNEPGSAAQTEPQASGSHLAALLVGSDVPVVPAPAASSYSSSYASSGRQQTSRLEQSFSSVAPSTSDAQSPTIRNAKTHIDLGNSLLSPAGVLPPAQPVVEPVAPVARMYGAPATGEPLVSTAAPSNPDSPEDRLASLESRNSPFLQSQTTVSGRSGQTGFDHLLVEQADFEASSTIANSVRVGLAVKPTYLDGGSADGTSTLRFGSSATGATFGPQSASGLAADAQISSQTFGLHLGTSPQGFLTHEFLGGFRFTPLNGPITILVQRDNVTDTLLSFAGAKDPATGQIWGGVVSNSGTLLGHWGDSKSGLYASVGYASITGKNVLSNRSVNGNFGTYWKVLARKEGSLTVGTNFSAMHYDNNLRYFTLGQGGYFSPQQYFLFGVPFRWTGTYNNRLQYVLAGSLGVQHMEEDASALFPLISRTATADGYAAQANTGANFSFDARVNYQMSPHWLIGAFATANNARDYTASAAGMFVKYTFEARPLGFENAINSVPDWRGQQPFSLF